MTKQVVGRLVFALCTTFGYCDSSNNRKETATTIVSQLSFEGQHIMCDYKKEKHIVSDLSRQSAQQIKNWLKTYHATLADPLTISVAWNEDQVIQEKLQALFRSVFNIKKVTVNVKGRVNHTARKLKTIRIGRFSAKDLRLTTALEFLKNKSRSLDPEGIGLNFIYLPEVDAKAKSLRTSLDLNNTTLEDVVKMLCTNLELKYRIEYSAVIIGRQLPPETKLPASIQQKFGKVIVRKVAFSDTRVSTALRFLKSQAKTLSPEKDGLRLSIKLSAAKEPSDEATVSVDCDRLPIIDALTYVCYSAKLSLHEKDGIIHITNRR